MRHRGDEACLNSFWFSARLPPRPEGPPRLLAVIAEPADLHRFGARRVIERKLGDQQGVAYTLGQLGVLARLRGTTPRPAACTGKAWRSPVSWAISGAWP